MNDFINDFKADTEDVAVGISEIKEVLKDDPEMFIQFNLGEDLIFDVPFFHIDIFLLLTSTTAMRAVLAIPRGHAKTTLSKLAVVHYFLFTDFSFIVYVSNTNPVAKEAVSDIIGFMHTENFIQVWGEIEMITKNASTGAYRFRIPGINKICILKALGAQQQMRGINVNNQRPQLAVVDDLEDYENTDSEIQIKKLRQWVFGTFMKALDRRKQKIIWLGNMLSNDSILKSICDNPKWHSRVYGAILADGKPLWPDMWSIESLVDDYKEYQRDGQGHTWMAEMMNNPLPEGNGLIKASEITYKICPFPEECDYAFITIDPAISEKTWADNTAIVVHGFFERYWMPVDYYLGTTDPIRLFDLTMNLAMKWGVRVIAIEGTAYQASLQHFFPYLMQERGMYGYDVIKLDAGAKKTERLAPWAALLKNKEYVLPEGDFAITKQLLEYDPMRKRNDDDLIDACAYGPAVIRNYLGLIAKDISLYPHGQTKKVIPEIEICGV